MMMMLPVNTDRDIADLETQAAKLDGVNADTNITVNAPPRASSERPKFQLPARGSDTVIAEQPVAHPGGPFGPPAPPATPTVSTRAVNRLNWGKIVKGALIVTAVVVAAYVTLGFASGLVHSAIMGLGAESTVASGLAVVTNTASSVAGTVGGWASTGLAYAGGFVETIGASLFGSSAASIAPALLTPAELAGTASAVSTGAGALAAGGVAAGGALVAKAALTQPMVDHVHQTVLHTPPAPTGLEDGNVATALGAKKQAAIHASVAGAGHDNHNAEVLAQKAASTASKMAHHAAHESEHAHRDQAEVEMGDHEGADIDADNAETDHRSRHALRQGLQAQRSWAADRARGSNYSRALHETGSHADAVRAASMPTERPSPRHAAFTEQLDHGRALADNTLETVR